MKRVEYNDGYGDIIIEPAGSEHYKMYIFNTKADLIRAIINNEVDFSCAIKVIIKG